jgi:hypothetical protein
MATDVRMTNAANPVNKAIRLEYREDTMRPNRLSRLKKDGGVLDVVLFIGVS